MKQFLLTVLLLAGLVLPAQDYRPFQPGKLYYYAANGNNFSVRVDSAGLVGADSAFWLNRVIGPACINGGFFTYHFRDGYEGQMGDHFIVGADGANRVVSQAGDTLVFHTRMPLMTSWPFLSGTSLTAMIQSRSAVTTFGIADSVLDIVVSDGNHYTFSQRFGLLQGINLAGYFSVSGAMQCQLIRAPLPPPHVRDYVRWQAGDMFTYVKDRGMQLGKFNRYVVRDRWANALGDSLWLEVDNHYTLTIPPNQDTIDYPVALDTLLYVDEMIAPALLATGEVDSTQRPIRVAHTWDYAAAFGGEIHLLYDVYPLQSPDLQVDSCGWWAAVAPPCDDPYPAQMAEGFGLLRRTYVIGQTMIFCITDVEELYCYRRGTDSVACPGWLLTGVAAPAPGIQGRFSLAGSAAGHPRLVWEGLAPGPYRISLSDLQGRILSQQSRLLGAAGDEDIVLPGSAGLYLLRVEDLAGGGTWTARLPQFGQ